MGIAPLTGPIVAILAQLRIAVSSAALAAAELDAITFSPLAETNSYARTK